MKFKKIMCLSLIAILAISSIGMCSANSVDITFDISNGKVAGQHSNVWFALTTKDHVYIGKGNLASPMYEQPTSAWYTQSKFHYNQYYLII